MNEGAKVLRQILTAAERLDRDAAKYVQHARTEYHQARRYFAALDAEAAAPPGDAEKDAK